MIAVTIPSAWFISANDRLHWAEGGARPTTVSLKRYNESGPGGTGNTTRSLTTSLDLGKEWL